MKLLVTGASGLVGSALRERLAAAKHDVWRLDRAAGSADPKQLRWNPAAQQIPAAVLDGFDAVVHLAGENIAAKRWTAERKAVLRSSRVDATRLLATTLAQLRQRPRTLVCASAVGIYGDRGDELLTESSGAGEGFLAELGRDWEEAVKPAEDAGIRVVHLRFGIILTPRGGALAKLLPMFRAGLGGVIGSGRQYWPWISLDDATGVIEHALFTGDLRGPVNAVAPQECTNREFTAALARALKRPAIVPAPAFALRLALGEMADAALLSGQRVQPAKLLASRYTFQHPTLDAAFAALLG
jgi:hypothetical protein